MRPLVALPPPLLLLIAATTSASAFAAAQTIETLDDGLIIEVTAGPETCDRSAKAGDRILVHYKGTLQSDGSKFDSSYDRDTPFGFLLGAGRVIKGWDEGLVGTCVGQSRKLTIPAALGYGDWGSGPIPGGATLIFETELLEIAGVSQAPVTTSVMPTTSSSTSADFSIATAPSIAEDDDEMEKLPIDDSLVTSDSSLYEVSSKDSKPEQAQCHLLGPFALFVQGALGALAVLTLLVKRWLEVPKRPWKIFFFDVSKQVFGSMLTHVINLAMSMFSAVDMANAAAHVAATAASTSGYGKGKSPNPCSFYVLNLGIDTTVGVPILWLLLKILYHLFLQTPLANPPESIKSGHYGQPPNVKWYLKQLLIYSIGLIFMKLFVFFLFLAMPFLPWIGDWALRWTEGNEALQIAFALFIFPLAMNAVQYYVIDNFIMDKKKGGTEGYTRVEGDDEDQERSSSYEEDVSEEDIHVKGGPEEGLKRSTLQEIDPLPVTTTATQNRGEGSRRSSPDDGSKR